MPLSTSRKNVIFANVFPANLLPQPHFPRTPAPCSSCPLPVCFLRTLRQPLAPAPFPAHTCPVFLLPIACLLSPHFLPATFHSPNFPACLPRIPPAHCLSAFSTPFSSFNPTSPRAHPQGQTPANLLPLALLRRGLTGFEQAWESHHCPLTTGPRPAIRVPKPQGFGTFLLSQCLVSALRKALSGPFFGSKGYTLSAYTLYPFGQNTTTPSNDHPIVCGPKHYTLSAKTLLPLQPEKCTVWGNRPRPRGAKGGGERGN